jgi:hypothetical protein
VKNKRIYTNYLIIGLLAIVPFFMFHGCYYDSKEYMFPEVTGSCDTTSVTYTTSIQPVLDRYCLACHSNNTAQSYGANVKLEDYSDVVVAAKNGSLYGAMSHDAGYYPMPKGASQLSDCILISFKVWIEAGAPNN